jgi:hypothetical protein
MRLIGKLANASQVTAQERDEMYVLMDSHYENVDRPLFEADLHQKRWVILIHDSATERLRGFSTQTLLSSRIDGRVIKALFSGDTIVHRECWGDSALPHVWGRLALTLIDACPGEELYWFLISGGYKTYRFLPVFFHEFYPRYDTPTPGTVRAIIDALAQGSFPEAYDAANGVIRATSVQYRLRPGLADVTPERLRDPNVRFFHLCNPGYTAGDELCCLAPLTRANFTPAAYRVIAPEPVALGMS